MYVKLKKNNDHLIAKIIGSARETDKTYSYYIETEDHDFFWVSEKEIIEFDVQPDVEDRVTSPEVPSSINPGK